MEENKVLTGVCAYCGQIQRVDLSDNVTAAEANAAATASCCCVGGQRSRLKRKTVKTINEVFGAECEPPFSPVEDYELSVIIEIANDLAEENISKATLVLRNGCICKMKFKDLESIEVVREEKKKIKRSN